MTPFYLRVSALVLEMQVDLWLLFCLGQILESVLCSLHKKRSDSSSPWTLSVEPPSVKVGRAPVRPSGSDAVGGVALAASSLSSVQIGLFDELGVP